MFLPPSPPPPEPQRITAVEPARLCPRLDLTCRIEYANDVLQEVARWLRSSASSHSGSSDGDVVVTPGTGQLALTGFAPTVITGSAQSAA